MYHYDQASDFPALETFQAWLTTIDPFRSASAELRNSCPEECDLDLHTLDICSVPSGVSRIPRCEESSASSEILPIFLKAVFVRVTKLGSAAVGIPAVPWSEYLDLPRSGRRRGMHGRVTANVGSSPVKMKGMVIE